MKLDQEQVACKALEAGRFSEAITILRPLAEARRARTAFGAAQPAAVETV